MPRDFQDPFPDFDAVPAQADKFEAFVVGVVRKQIDALSQQDSDVNWEEVASLLENEHDIIANEGGDAFQAHFKDANGDIDNKKLAAYERLVLVKNTARSYVPTLLERAHNSETNASADMIANIIADQKNLGYSADDSAKFFDQDAKASKSPTGHPTEGLSIDGIKLCFDLVHAAEKLGDDQDAAIEQTLTKMIMSDNFGSSKKFTILDEIDLSDLYARNHNAGVNKLERHIETSILDTYGEKKRVVLDAALRSWDFDSDGKNNAEGFAFMAKSSTTTMGALDDIIGGLDVVMGAGRITPEIEAAYADVVKIKEALQPVYNRSREITQELAEIADPEARKAYYTKVYKEELPKLKEQFKSIYNGVGSGNRGFDTYKKIVTDLEQILDSDGVAGVNNFEALDDAMRTIRRNGIVLEKGQPRQNDFKHIETIDNLFNNDALRELGVFRQGELDEIDEHGGLGAIEDIARQKQLMDKVVDYIGNDKGRRTAVMDMLFDSNPLEFEKNGYPNQTRSNIDRLEIRQMFQLKYEQAITSDSQPGSNQRTHFLFSVMGIQNGSSMSLYEDKKNLADRPNLIKGYFRNAGVSALGLSQIFNRDFIAGTSLDKTANKDSIQSMDPASDAERNGGWATRMEVFHKWRKIGQLSFKKGVSMAQMIGGGMSMNRFGGDPMIVSNVVAEELKHLAKKKLPGGAFDRGSRKHRHIMRSATSLLFTEQGRQKRFNMATPDQVADDYARKYARMAEIRFDLEGLVKDHTFIKKKSKFKDKSTEKFMRNLWKNSIDRYGDMRFAKDHAGKTILNRLADFITTPNIIGFKNNGARPATKGGGAPRIIDVRAIENDGRFFVSQTFTGGFYGAGQMMKDLGQGLRDKKIDFGDVKDWINHSEWDYSVHNKCLVDAGRFDATYSLKQLDMDHMSFDKLKAIGEHVEFSRDGDDKDSKMLYSGPRENLTDEQIYLAKIWYDRLVYISSMEAALKGPKGDVTLKSDVDDIIAAFRPKNNSPHFGLGERVKEQWKDIVVTTLNEHEKNKPQFETQYLREAQLKRDVDEKKLSAVDAIERQGGEGAIRASGSSYRAGTAPHWKYWTGAFSYGQDKKLTGNHRRKAIQPTTKAYQDLLKIAQQVEHDQRVVDFV